jgi:DNA-binding MarR family transcriptional regulator
MDEKKKEWGRRIQEGVEEDARDENIKRTQVTLIIKDQKSRLPDYVMVFQWFSSYAGKNLKPSTCKVLFFLISISEYENFLSIDVATIIDQVGMSKRSIQEAIKELKETNIISVIPHPNDKRRNDYFLNPFASWKGTSTQREKFIKKAKNQQMKLEFPNISPNNTNNGSV